MNPNVQVAFISVLATTITTAGVIMSAIISNRRMQAKIVNLPEEKNPIDEGDILERLLILIEENERKEKIIVNLRKKIHALQVENAELRHRLESKN